MWAQPTALRGRRDPSEASEPVLPGLGMPQNCIVCPLLETALGRSEARKEFVKFLIMWLKRHQYKAQAAVTDGELRCFVKSCPMFWEVRYLYKPALKPPTHAVSVM